MHVNQVKQTPTGGCLILPLQHLPKDCLSLGDAETPAEFFCGKCHVPHSDAQKSECFGEQPVHLRHKQGFCKVNCVGAILSLGSGPNRTHILQIARLLLKSADIPRPLGHPTETRDESNVWTASADRVLVLLSKRARIETIRKWQRESRDSLWTGN